ncbi:MAG: hypothetical protein JST60_04315 [Chloroflexi bacterium SZAS-1]|nr:hypothetical protein [Chloroflexi bacterium SZAS-1]
MTLGKQLIEQLRATEQPAEQPLTVVYTTQSAAVAFFDRDRYSVALRDMLVRSGSASPDDTRTFLNAAAATVARRLSFLEEPLALWELDGSEGIAQLRSSPPQREGDALSYWEVTLWAEQPRAQVARYHWQPGMAEREVVAYPAIFALLGRVADALAAALAEPMA